MSVIPWIDKGRALAVRVATPFLLLGAFRLREGSLFTYGFGRRIVDGNLFSLTAGRTLAFHRCHDGLFDRNR